MGKSAQLIKSFLGKAEYSLSGLNMQSGELLVLNYHGTQKKFIPEFERQLDFLARHFSFFTPFELEDYYYRGIRPSGPSVLITFDDGIKNNLHAAKLLAERNIKSLFFIVSGFADADVAIQEQYFKKNIRMVVDESVGYLDEDHTAMEWPDLLELLQLGHSIGAHSATHTLQAAGTDNKKSTDEILGCKVKIEERLATIVSSFCAPNNSLLSCGPVEMKLIKSGYRFFFSTIPGSNVNENNPFFIHRSNVEVNWSKGAFIQAIGKWDQRRWAKKSALFRKIAE
jgi:peptidoglycan/xylan/chitin deacetylase (PgdA/CDA1 family)